MLANEDAAAVLLAEAREQQALIGSLNQLEAVRSRLEQRPGRFIDPSIPNESHE